MEVRVCTGGDFGNRLAVLLATVQDKLAWVLYDQEVLSGVCGTCV